MLQEQKLMIQTVFFNQQFRNRTNMTKLQIDTILSRIFFPQITLYHILTLNGFNYVSKILVFFFKSYYFCFTCVYVHQYFKNINRYIYMYQKEQITIFRTGSNWNNIFYVNVSLEAQEEVLWIQKINVIESDKEYVTKFIHKTTINRHLSLVIPTSTMSFLAFIDRGLQTVLKFHPKYTTVFRFQRKSLIVGLVISGAISFVVMRM